MLSPYGGERGVIERFVGDATSGSAGATAGVFILYPAANAVGGFSAVNSATATAIGTGAAVAPTFMTNNVRKVRTLAACLELIPASLSITNITGELAMGVFDQTTFNAGSSYTVDAIFTNCNEREVIQKRDYEIKWFPGSADHLYSGRQVGNPTFAAAEPSSANVIVIAWRGIPAGTLFSFRSTIVYEWTPEPSLGLAVTSTPGVAQDWENQSAALHTHEPDWWKGGKIDSAAVPSSQMGSFAGRMRYVASQGRASNFMYKYLADGQALSDAMSVFSRSRR
jgi:hypothetical protein